MRKQLACALGVRRHVELGYGHSQIGSQGPSWSANLFQVTMFLAREALSWDRFLRHKGS